MISELPPVPVKHIEIVEQKINPSDYEVKKVKTYKEAQEASAHGGYITKNYDGGFVVVYIPIRR